MEWMQPSTLTRVIVKTGHAIRRPGQELPETLSSLIGGFITLQWLHVVAVMQASPESAVF